MELLYNQMMLKKCSKCDLDKPLNEFSKKSSSKDGLQNWCKDCVSGYSAEYNAKPENILKQKERNAKYNAKPENILKRKEYGAKPERILYQKEYSAKPENILKQKERNAKPEIKLKQKERNAKPENILYQREYRSKPERILYQKEYSAKPETKLKRKERDAKPERKLKQKDWQKKNPDKKNASTANRRALKIQCSPSWLTKEQKRQNAAFYAEARRLTLETGIPHEVDHIIPLNHELASGLHVPWNLQILTQHENRVKSNKFDGTPENNSWRKDLLLND